MPQGLSVSRVVDVQVSCAPLASPLLNFDTLLILGDSNVIDTGEAIREYNRLEDVAADFGTTAPEYKAASLFFSQRLGLVFDAPSPHGNGQHRGAAVSRRPPASTRCLQRRKRRQR